MAEKDWKRLLDDLRDRIAEMEDRTREWLLGTGDKVPVPVPVDGRPGPKPRR